MMLAECSFQAEVALYRQDKTLLPVWIGKLKQRKHGKFSYIWKLEANSDPMGQFVTSILEVKSKFNVQSLDPTLSLQKDLKKCPDKEHFGTKLTKKGHKFGHTEPNGAKK